MSHTGHRPITYGDIFSILKDNCPGNPKGNKELECKQIRTILTKLYPDDTKLADSIEDLLILQKDADDPPAFEHQIVNLVNLLDLCKTCTRVAPLNPKAPEFLPSGSDSSGNNTPNSSFSSPNTTHYSTPTC